MANNNHENRGSNGDLFKIRQAGPEDTEMIEMARMMLMMKMMDSFGGERHNSYERVTYDPVMKMMVRRFMKDAHNDMDMDMKMDMDMFSKMMRKYAHDDHIVMDTDHLDMDMFSKMFKRMK